MFRIISLVLEWDTSDFRKATEAIKRSKNGPTDSQLAAIDEHLQAPREKHESIRESSKQVEKSIVIAILEDKNPDLIRSLSESQHTQCLEYYSAQLAIRDRQKIIDALCRQNPDLTTSLVRDAVAVFEPMIRAIHKNVDLRKHIGSIERFLTDLIETSKPKKQDDGQGQGLAKKRTVPPSVEDYVALLKRNRLLAYDYLYDFAKGCPDLRVTWLGWVKSSLRFFGQTPDSNSKTVPTEMGASSSAGAGAMDKHLQDLFDTLPEERRTAAQSVIDEHAKYLATLEEISNERMQKILDKMHNQEKKSSGNMSGPGVYITRWHCLLDATAVTPRTPRGPPRKGKDVKGLKALGKTEAVASSETWNPEEIAGREPITQPEPPDVSVVVEALGSQFQALVANISGQGLTTK